MREQKQEYRIAHFLNSSLIKNKIIQLSKAKNASVAKNSIVKIYSLTIETKQ
jgi:hypothetical protein